MRLSTPTVITFGSATSKRKGVWRLKPLLPPVVLMVALTDAAPIVFGLVRPAVAV